MKLELDQLISLVIGLLALGYFAGYTHAKSKFGRD